MRIRDTEDRQYSGQHSTRERTKSQNNFPQNPSQITKECKDSEQQKLHKNVGEPDQSFVCVPLLVLLSDRPTRIHVDTIYSSLCTYKKMYVNIIICMCSISL